MKFHFGHGLVLMALIFMGFIVYLVSQMIGQKIDLVEDDYYEKGLEYQQVIDEKKHERNCFKLEQDGNSLVLKTTEEGISKKVALELYRPSNSSLDTLVNPTLNTSGESRIDASGWAKGQWHYTLHFEEAGFWYFQKGDLNLQ
ncbi:MAG: hypothetical protein GC180_05630 [Bacteroidetes bacterium]|nr:hypothetical protein [Bacteroidota bacterium]